MFFFILNYRSKFPISISLFCYLLTDICSIGLKPFCHFIPNLQKRFVGGLKLLTYDAHVFYKMATRGHLCAPFAIAKVTILILFDNYKIRFATCITTFVIWVSSQGLWFKKKLQRLKKKSLCCVCIRVNLRDVKFSRLYKIGVILMYVFII